MSPSTRLDDDLLSRLDRALSADDLMIAGRLEPARSADTRQPVHTVYVPGDVYRATTAQDWGRLALEHAANAGGVAELCRLVGVADELAEPIGARVEAKLDAEPIEDVRIDFEDGYGDRGDKREDADVERAALAVAHGTGPTPPFVGLRIKSFERPTRARGVRTLELFLATLIEHGELPAGLTITLPKVSTLAQVDAMAETCAALETAYGLRDGRLRFEVQVETPAIVLAPDGTWPLARVVHESGGRVAGLHFGTYDYSAALGIAAAHQSLDHPAADFAKSVMQLAVAGTDVRLSDGSTNVLPVGDAAQRRVAWTLHRQLVLRALARGFYQGWDLHPAQLLTRHIAGAEFYRSGLPEARDRLVAYRAATTGGFLDEPATAAALTAFLRRGVRCGAIDSDELPEGLLDDAPADERTRE